MCAWYSGNIGVAYQPGPWFMSHNQWQVTFMSEHNFVLMLAFSVQSLLAKSIKEALKVSCHLCVCIQKCMKECAACCMKYLAWTLIKRSWPVWLSLPPIMSPYSLIKIIHGVCVCRTGKCTCQSALTNRLELKQTFWWIWHIYSQGNYNVY